MHLSGVVGDNLDSRREIRFLYYRELERWISRFFLNFHSDIDSVKQGPLYKCNAIPNHQNKTSFSSVFNEFHLSVEFSDLFVSRIMNWSGEMIGQDDVANETSESAFKKPSQALWATSRGSALNMDWRKGIVDARDKSDWAYYYGEIEFLDAHFCVSSSDAKFQSSTMKSKDFGISIPGVEHFDLIKAPRLFYLSLDENCFQFDPGKN